MLVHLLRSHPRVLCHGEVFGPKAIGSLAGSYLLQRRADPDLDSRLWRFRHKDPPAFLEKVVFEPQGHAAVGFKFKTDEAFNRRWRDIQELVVRDALIQVIRLKRRDVLSIYISHHVVLHQGVSTLVREGEPSPQPERFRADAKAVVAYVHDVIRREQLADEAYRDHAQMTAWYEDLLDATHPIHGEMANFLGVQPAPLATPTRKILSDNWSLLTNLEEILAVLEKEGYRVPAARD